MVIRVFISTMSGNMEIKKRQEYIRQVLETRKIDYEQVDIAAVGSDNNKQFMKDNCQPEEGKDFVLPPQVFNDTVYCGDYNSFQEAVEMEALPEFLKLPPGVGLVTKRKDPMSEPMQDPVMEHDAITCS